MRFRGGGDFHGVNVRRHRSAAGDTPDHGAVHGARRPRQHCAMNRPRTPAPAPRASAQEKNTSVTARATLQALATLPRPQPVGRKRFSMRRRPAAPGPIRTNSVSLYLVMSRFVSLRVSLCLTSRLALSRFVSEYLGFSGNERPAQSEMRCRHSRVFIMLRRGGGHGRQGGIACGDRHGAMPRLSWAQSGCASRTEGDSP